MKFLVFIKAHKDIMLLPVILALLFVTVLIILNKGSVDMPFIYAGF